MAAASNFQGNEPIECVAPNTSFGRQATQRGSFNLESGQKMIRVHGLAPGCNTFLDVTEHLMPRLQFYALGRSVP